MKYLPDNKIITLEEFQVIENKRLACRAGRHLQKVYPGYMWGVRAPDDTAPLIMITLAELLELGGGQQGMVVHPRDWSCMEEFDRKVKFYGGELLERAKLFRGRSLQVRPTDLPDGFLPNFDKTRKVTRLALKPEHEAKVKTLLDRGAHLIKA